jgi:Mrp family chromosome partitioning ATPase/capsular polysaccharide biosynthesis protein
MQPSPPQITTEPTVLSATWRYRWLTLAAALLFGAAAYVLVTATSTTEYQAVASMQLEDPRSSILFDVGTRQRTQDYVADQVSILESGEVARRTAEISSATDGVDLDANEVLSSLGVSFSENSSVVFIIFRHAEADDATAGANGVIQAYQELLRQETEATFASSIQVLEDSIDELLAQNVATLERIQELTVGGDPARVDLAQQYSEALPRVAELIDQLSRASGENRDRIRGEIDDFLLQLQVLAQINNLESENPELTTLLDQRARTSARIDDLEERRDRIRLDSQLLSSGVTLSTPAFGASAVPTDVARATAVGLILGLIFGAALSYGLALRRRNFTDRTQPESIIGAPLIAEIPTFKQEGIKTSLPVRTDPRSASAEAFRFAAAALDMPSAMPLGSVVDGRVVAIVSPAIGEGKTVVAANTALAAALEGRRVLLIDADFGNQMATELLAPDVRPEYGITEVVEAGVALSDAVIPIEGTESTGLHLLSRGWQQTTAPEFFRLPATRSFMQQIQEFYDVVLIDGPPLLQVAYASTLAGLASKVLVVVPHGGALASVEELQDRLDLIGTPPVGYVYNLAPLRYEMTRTEGSMKDVLGAPPAA